MDDNIKLEDFEPLSNALARWWESQRVKPLDAAFLMVGMAGGITGGMIAKNEKHLKEGLTILVKEMHRSAHAAYAARQRP